MPKMEINVDAVLTCATAMKTEVGDKVLILNGLVVGMIEKRRPAAPSQPPAPAPAPPYIQDETIIDMLRKGPLSVRNMNQRLGFRDRERRTQLKRRVVRLVARSIVAPVNDARFPKYRLISNPLL